MRWTFIFIFLASTALAAGVKKIPLAAKADDYNTFLFVKIRNHTNKEEKVRIGDANTMTVGPQSDFREKITLTIGKNYIVTGNAQCFLMAQDPGVVFLVR